MIDPTEDEHHALACVVRAGGSGVLLGEQVTTSQAIRFAQHRLAEISATFPQTVRATALGVSFSRRGAFA